MSGKLIMNALVMYDRETDTLWSQFLGEAVQGPLSGTKLSLVSSQLVSWSAWKEQHPDTLALDIKTATRDSYLGYYFSGDAGVLGETHRDARLPTKELVVGIVGEMGERAYAFRDLMSSGVVNDSFEGRDLVVAMTANSGATAVYDRSVDEMTLTFDEADDPLLMTDRETGSSWNKTTGEAVSGTLKGTRLQQVPFIRSFWFGWTDFYPQTELYLF